MCNCKNIIEPLLNREEAARYLGTTAGTLAFWDSTKRYDLRPIKLGRRSVRYRRADLDRFLEEYMPTRPD
jgi:predicted DNA-binding transcriptional regulator AlpA